MSFVFAVMSCSRGKRTAPGRLGDSLRALPERPPSARLDSRWRNAGNVQGGPCDEDMSVLAAADRERRELTERHRLPGTLPPERRWALRRQRNDGRERSRAALHERSARVHQEKHRRQEPHSVRWRWNRVVSGMLTASVARRGAVT